MKMISMKKMQGKQRGSFVLEALIAILLFAIGILAIVGLQAASIRNTAGSKYRTDASLLANQIIGQMWVGDKTNATLATNFCGGPAASIVVTGASAVCNTAGPNYQAWANSVSQKLPGVIVTGTNATNMPSIAIESNNGIVVTIQWMAPKEDAPHNYSTVANIND
jgi:type IV pilus assembly protein PilV